MNGIDNGFESAEVTGPSDEEQRARLRSVLRRVANVSLAASLFALPVAVFQPNGWGPSIAFGAFVLCLLTHHLRREV